MTSPKRKEKKKMLANWILQKKKKGKKRCVPTQTIFLKTLMDLNI